MKEYDELIEILRYCGQGKGCKECPLWDKPSNACFQASADAADAIERLMAEVEHVCPGGYGKENDDADS